MVFAVIPAETKNTGHFAGHPDKNTGHIAGLCKLISVHLLGVVAKLFITL